MNRTWRVLLTRPCAERSIAQQPQQKLTHDYSIPNANDFDRRAAFELGDDVALVEVLEVVLVAVVEFELEARTEQLTKP